MRLLINILIISLFPIFLSSSIAEITDESERYCNERFNYCLEYPSDYFLAPIGASNGDGILLTTKDNKVRVRVAGSYNVMDWSIKDVYYFNFEHLIKETKEIEHLESTFDETYGEVSLKIGEEITHYQIYLLNDAYTILTISVPEDAEELLTQLKEATQLSVNL